MVIKTASSFSPAVCGSGVAAAIVTLEEFVFSWTFTGAVAVPFDGTPFANEASFDTGAVGAIDAAAASVFCTADVAAELFSCSG